MDIIIILSLTAHEYGLTLVFLNLIFINGSLYSLIFSSFTSLVRFTPKYFILGATVKSILF